MIEELPHSNGLNLQDYWKNFLQLFNETIKRYFLVLFQKEHLMHRGGCYPQNFF
jgi:hypothetical protein